MALDTLADRLAPNAVPSNAMLFDGDLAALDPTAAAGTPDAAGVVDTAAASATDLTDNPDLSPQTSPVVTGLNDTVLDFHAGIEGSADAMGTPGAVHGLTNLGETTGLGEIGGDNLVTHALYAPTDLAAGNTGDVTALPSDASHIADAGVGLVNGALSDVATADSGGLQSTLSTLESGGGAAAVTPLADSALLSPTGNPVAQALNGTVMDFHYSIEGAADAMGTPGAVHGLTNLGETVGLGKIGDDNALTHVLDAPGDVLAGDTSDLTALPSDVGHIGTAATGLVTGALSDAGTVLNGGTVIGQPVEGVVNSVAQTLGGVADGAGLHDTGSAIDALGSSGLVGDVQHVATDTLGTASTATGAVGAITTAFGNDVSALTGQTPSAGGLLGTGSSAGAHDAADASVGPSGSGGGTINVLGTPVTDAHTLDVHALALPASAPAGVAVAALGDGDALHFGSTGGGGGGDALLGSLAAPATEAVHAAAPEAAPAPEAAMPIDLHQVAGLDTLTHHI